MKTLNVELGARSYPVLIGSGLLREGTTLADAVGARQIMIVTNDIVGPLYLGALENALAGRELEVVVLEDGERHKTLATFSRIIDRLIEARFRRDACVVALGGGVVGDIAGFAAASYHRGIDLVQVPTTILAQVDSSVGGKTAVNHPLAKNIIGAFHQPIAVLADTKTLRTLPERELRAGMAEIIKYGLIEDIELFAWLERHLEELLALDDSALAFAIARSCEIKAAIVAEDEREQGRRALLNLGHTFGHALEALGNYERWLHGEAVAIGIAIAAKLSEALGSITADDCARIDALLARAGLPVAADGVDAAAILAKMELDKKADRAGPRLVLLERLGRAVVARAPDRTVVGGAIAARIGS